MHMCVVIFQESGAKPHIYNAEALKEGSTATCFMWAKGAHVTLMRGSTEEGYLMKLIEESGEPPEDALAYGMHEDSDEEAEEAEDPDEDDNESVCSEASAVAYIATTNPEDMQARLQEVEEESEGQETHEEEAGQEEQTDIDRPSQARRS